MTPFNQFTFFHVDINQSQVENSFQPASDWIRSARKNVNKLKAVSLLGSLHAVELTAFGGYSLSFVCVTVERVSILAQCFKTGCELSTDNFLSHSI